MKVINSTGTILESNNPDVIREWKKSGMKEVPDKKKPAGKPKAKE
jgi:hypothetical protein